METRVVENADATGRTSAAAQSLAAWYRREMQILTGAKQIARESISRGEGDVEQTRRSLAQLEEEETELHDAWEASSLRRKIESRTGHGESGGIEQRLVLAESGPSHLAFGSRATETSRDTTAKSIQGYAIIYNKLSEDLGGFVELIECGACTAALRASDIRALFNHNSNCLLGRSSATTLELREDSAGVYFHCHLLPYDGVSYGIARRIGRLDLTGCSFSFSGVTDRWVLKAGQIDRRIISRIDHIYDIGPVTYPAYRGTSVTATFEKAERAAAPAQTHRQRLRPIDAGREERLRSLECRLHINPALSQVERRYRRKMEQIARAYRA